MPNYVRNNVYLDGPDEDVKALKDFVSSEETCFDFDKIIPMPRDLEIESGSVEDLAIKCYRASLKGRKTCIEYDDIKWTNKKTFEEYVELGRQYVMNMCKYDAATWYDWRNKNWGTKWNACDAEDHGTYISFDTAWNMPEPVYRALAKKFPTVKIYVEFADEDIGSNCGELHLNYDDISNEVMYINSPEMACDVWGYDYEEYCSEND